jgi:putative transposase
MSNTVLKLALKPIEEDISTLDGQSRICNWLYNHLVEKASLLRGEFCETQNSDTAKTLYTKRGLRNLLPKIKEEKPFLKVVHSSPLKNTALRLSHSIQSYQKSKKGKRKGKLGWPKFRSWKEKWFSLLYDEPGKGFNVQDNILILSLGVGQDRKRRSLSIPITDSHLLKGKAIRNLRITCELGVYYAIFTIQQELPKTKPTSKVIALDPNHKNLCYGVDLTGKAIEIAAPIWLKKYDKRLDELKSKRDRCKKKSKKVTILNEQGEILKEYYLPSKQWKKCDDAYKKALRKRREQTKTFMFTTAHNLFRDYDCVAIGDYTPHGEGITTPMRRAMNNRSLIGRFKEVLSWVAEKSGKTFLEFDEKGTTRTCNKCLHEVEGGIPLAIREWECPHCKTFHIRDENAAINGLKKILWDLREKNEAFASIVSGSDLGSVKERWAWCVSPSGVVSTLRGRNSEIFAASGN